jgi:hypothetical protein
VASGEHNISVAILIAAGHISEALSEVATAIRAIGPQASKLVLKYTLRGEDFFTMGAAITNAQVGQIYDPTVVESNATTPSIPPAGALVYATDNAAVAAVDPATGIATMVGPGTANISVMDQGDNLTDTVAFTVAAAPPPPPPPATKLDLEYKLQGAPVQAAEPSRPFGR